MFKSVQWPDTDKWHLGIKEQKVSSKCENVCTEYKMHKAQWY